MTSALGPALHAAAGQLGSGDTTVAPDVLARLDAVPLLRGPDRQIVALTGGLTNQNFLVSIGDHRFVARLAGQSSELLAIDRRAEYENCLMAAETGTAPPVLAFDPDAAVLVVDFLDGRTLAEEDLGDEQMVIRIADACRTLHTSRSFVSDFDMFAIRERYLDTALSLGLRLPERYLDFVPQLEQLRRVLQGTGTTTPCHNDLLAANFIVTGSDANDPVGPRLWIIDFEYSGNNDPCFELGNIASESHLDDDALVALVDRYVGRHDEPLIARTRLQALMSQYGWTLWGVLQKATSALDFDFTAWYLDKYDRAATTFTGPDLARWLDVAAGAPEP